MITQCPQVPQEYKGIQVRKLPLVGLTRVLTLKLTSLFHNAMMNVIGEPGQPGLPGSPGEPGFGKQKKLFYFT